jgi:hypothetical protein
LCNRYVEILEEEIQHIIVDPPVLLDLLKAEETHLSAVLSDAAGHVLVSFDADGVNTESSK